MSVISSTDVECFRRLSNPEVVDLTTNAASSRQIAQQMREAMERAVATTASKTGEDSDDEDGRTPEPPPQQPTRQASSLSSAISALRSSASAQAPPEKSAQAPSSLPVRAPPPGPTAGPSLSRIEEEEASSDGDAPAPSAPAQPPPQSASGPKDPEATRLEKQGVLLELHALESKGVRLTRSFSMADSLNEMEFELQKQTSLLNTAGAVQNMKDVLRLGLNGMELANAKLGPFVCMEGWAESLTSDMKRFDAPLEKLYKRYWRKSTMSPIMELGMIILGSLAMHHFRTKMFGRAASPPPREEQTYRQSAGERRGGGPVPNAGQAPPIQTGRPRKLPPAVAAAPGDARARRPVLRSPTSLLGL